ncbi:NAD(P)-dependent oxidoreductase [Spiractinospora alimapuensis]|uniref:NAD(P)-dependent oxidoreductase n=1 Tax=Spiractinospora alimapuensis TaxID=2820884 RepID=UPI001F29B3DE|nr:NAD(P)-binding domain-containing protein [Spiractinospora alimapuensis]QVQ53756.1 NAD(P)-dependent oxidoreductase [Spiractinospora alimapuensis]
MRSSASAVTVIGLGPMGQAITRRLLDGEYRVTLWNRSPRRADPFVADGAVLAATPAEALAASELVILSLTDYRAMYDILAGSESSLDGRAVVNLSSDTPDRTREAARWATHHGATFLTGGVMASAPTVGTDEAFVYYSGPRHVLDQHRVALARIGTPRYLGADPGLAQLMYQAHLDVFLSTIAALTHATALMGTAGFSATDALAELVETVRGVPFVFGDGTGSPGAMFDSGEHPGDLSTVTMMAASADHVLAASESAGIDTVLPKAIHTHYRNTIADGFGADNWTRIIDRIRSPGGVGRQ